MHTEGKHSTAKFYLIGEVYNCPQGPKSVYCSAILSGNAIPAICT